MDNKNSFQFDEKAFKYSTKFTKAFKKDIKKALKRNLNLQKLYSIINTLAKGEQLPEENRDHQLTGNWLNHRECHIESDWLLIYQIQNDVLVLELTRTGTHSDLFGK